MVLGVINTIGIGIDSPDLLLVAHGAHGGVSLSLSGEADETEATATVGVAVLDNDL